MKYTTYAEPSEDACNHYNLFEEDIALMAQAGFNAYRFSVEWARIEPIEGHFDNEAIDHYKAVIKCCRKYGIEPMVTLHHFTSPKWIITKGGWEAESIVEDFARYVGFVIDNIGSDIGFVNTINEANMRMQFSRIMKNYMNRSFAEEKAKNLQVGVNVKKMLEIQQKMEEEEKSVFGLSEGMKANIFHSPCTKRGDELIINAHKAAKREIKKRYPNIKVGITLSLHDIQYLPGGEELANELWNEEFLHYLPHISEDDFIGVQNYTRELVGKDGVLPVPIGADITQSGYEFYPEGLKHVIRKVADKFGGDIYITENGISETNDEKRCEYIDKALAGVKRTIADGIPVKGYFYWSFIDNFEWQKGFAMKFGLVGVERKSQKRLPKNSFWHLGSYIKNNTEERI